MFRHLRNVIALAALPAALFLVAFSQEDSAASLPAAAGTDYPVILVHGLGGGPGEATFGKLQEYLEDFQYTVEVMDFNDYNNKKFARGSDAGNLGTLAAAVGNFVQEVLSKYKAEKVSIVAHSYGGLAVHAYLNNFGAEYDKNKGAFDDSVARVFYMQVPFYGSDAGEETLKELIAGTDYGRFLNEKEMLATLKVGSEAVYLLDKATRENNVYSFIDAVTMASDEDVVVKGTMASLRGTLDVVRPFNRLRIVQKYAHSSMNLSESKRGSFAKVENVSDRSFIGVASFLDNGRSWRRVGLPGPTNVGMLLVRVDKHNSMKKLNADDVTLKPRKKKSVEGQLNEDARVFAFLDLNPGEYTLTIKGKQTVTESLEIGGEDQITYVFDPAKSKLDLVGLAGLVSLPQVTIGAGRNSQTFDVNGLNVESFDVELILQKANPAGIDEGLIFGLYDAGGLVGADLDDNGSRLDLVIRGNAAGSNNANKVMLTMNIDKNNNRRSDRNEMESKKGGGNINWSGTNIIKLTVRREGGSTRFKVYINGNLLINTDGPGGLYRNAKPKLYIGGAVASEHKPIAGAVITNFVIKNGIAK